LKVNELINVDEMVSEGHLELLLSLIKISIKHLENSILGIDFSIVILLIDTDLFLELLSLGQT